MVLFSTALTCEFESVFLVSREQGVSIPMFSIVPMARTYIPCL